MPHHDNFIWHDPRPDTITRPCVGARRWPAVARIRSAAEGMNLTPRTTGYDATEMNPQGYPLTANRTSTPALIAALALAATFVATGLVSPARAQSAAAEGQR